VVIAGPTKQIYGAQVSGTVFASIANKVHSSSLQYHPNYNGTALNVQSLPDVKAGSAAETIVALNKMGVKHPDNTPRSGYVVARNSEGVVSLSQRKMDQDKVPNVVGMPLSDAVYLLENMKMKVQVNGSGKVLSQSVASGSNLTKGQTIKLVLG